MTTYLDSSVLLRVVLGQPGRIKDLRRIDDAVTSALTEVEVLRTIDRRFRQGLLEPDELAERRALALKMLARVSQVDVSPAVLQRAAEPFPLPMGTLDAIHLATSLLVRDQFGENVTVATHDAELAAAARACGLEVLGA